MQVSWKCDSGVDGREVIVHCSLFVVKHDERNNPWSNGNMVWDHLKTASGKVCNDFIDESTRSQFFKGPVNLSTPQLPRIFRTSCR